MTELLITFAAGAVLGTTLGVAIALAWAASEIRPIRRDIEELTDMVELWLAEPQEPGRPEFPPNTYRSEGDTSD